MLDQIRGGIWMGGMVEGSEGLTYFDGSRFFSPLKTAFPKVIVSGMVEDSEGGIWLATTGGVYRAFRGDLVRVADGSTEYGIAAAANDVFLAAVTKPGSNKAKLLRLARSTGGKWKTDIIMPLTEPSVLQSDGAGNILYVCDGGYCEFRADDAVRWRPGTALMLISHREVTLTPSLQASVASRDRFGCMWFRSVSQGEVHCAGGRANPSEEISGAGFPSIAELNDGTIVLPFFGKLAMGRPGHLRVISATTGFPGSMIAVATNDRSIWFCNGNGTPFVLPSLMPMEFWTEKEGLDGNTWSVVRTFDHTLAVAGESLLQLDKDRSRWSIAGKTTGLSHLTAGPDGTILLTTGFHEKFRLRTDGEPIGRLPAPSASDEPENRSCSDALASAGWDSDRASRLSQQANWLAQQQCVSLSREGGSEIWYTNWQREGGLNLLENPAGKVLKFATGSEVGNATVRFLGIDKRGWIWRGSPVGIYVADRELARQGQWLYLNRQDGIAGQDANRGSFFSDPDGSVWFGADYSINHLYPPSDLLHPATAPTIFLSGFSVNNGVPQMTELTAPLKSGDAVTALVASLLYNRRNTLRLRYRLLPEQKDWQQTASLDLVLGTLSAGTHTLEVQGRVFTGPWSSTVSHSFTVLRPAWLSAPFLWTYAGAALAVAGVIEWRRRRRIADEQSMLPDLGEWRMDALEPEDHPLCGTMLDRRYQVERLLARGGFASVLAAYDQTKHRPCAIKVFRGEVKHKPSTRQGFEQEVAALRKIRHPNVVSIYADGVTANGAPYLVMEFIEGLSLREILEEGPMQPARAARMLDQLAKALDAIHARGIFHRDMKPENVIVRNAGSDEQAVLIDFSIAIIKDVNETLHGISRAAGTFDYMAPEQALGYAQPSSDIFSLAKVVMEMLGGIRLSQRLPNVALDLPGRVLEILEKSKLPLSRESKEMLARALEFDPSKRPDKAGEFARPIVRDLRE